MSVSGPTARNSGGQSADKRRLSSLLLGGSVPASTAIMSSLAERTAPFLHSGWSPHTDPPAASPPSLPLR